MARHKQAQASSPPSATVTISSEFAFVPASLTVVPGTIVNFKCSIAQCNLRFLDATSANVLTPATEFSRTFHQQGQFEFYCENHVFMKGTITVTPPKGSAGRRQSPVRPVSSVIDSSVFDKAYSDYAATRPRRRKQQPLELIAATSSATKISFGRFADEEEDEPMKTTTAVTHQCQVGIAQFGTFDEDSEFDTKAALRFMRNRWEEILQDPDVVLV